MTDSLQAYRCPGCNHTGHSQPFTRPQQPVVLNYRFHSAQDALGVPRADISLHQCATCGLVFNGRFDISRIPYDEGYENRQSTSRAFQTHLQQRARDVLRRLPGSNARVLELGCGKGEFLALLARQSHVVGEGYDTSYDGSVAGSPDRLTFHRRYLVAADISVPAHALVCRHVIEHVPDVAGFLDALAAIAHAAGDPVIFLETPRLEWMVDEGSLWDVFYEHVNYFSMPTLDFLVRQAGFDVLRHVPVLGGQYQWLELRGHPAHSPGARTALRPGYRFRPGRPPGIHPQSRLCRFTHRAHAKMESFVSRLQERPAGSSWGIWGAGAKGVTLTHLLTCDPPAIVIDTNPAKQGCFIPGSSVPVVSPTDPRARNLSTLLVANPHYLDEIRKLWRELDLPASVRMVV